MALPEAEGLRVTFNPPLYLQRQIWVLDILRREKVQSVLDIGCGEGSLLQCLTEPSYTLPPTTSLPPTSPFVLGTGANALADLYLHTIHGLDPCASNLELAILGTSPSSPDRPPFTGYERWTRRNARWMRLEVSLWEGGFEAVNDAFARDAVDAFVASEVIEHLAPELLSLFAPVILGHYRPRLLLLTTPNYTYNQRFTPPGEVSPTGYPDATGRTDRVFRHSDHKFEWTAEEWAAYCNDAASKYGYSVDIGGIGGAVEPDPWSREDALGFASQIALFRRITPDAPQPVKLDELRNFAATSQAVLRAKHIHEPHPLSPDELALPPNLAQVREAAKEAIAYNRKGTLTFNDLWKHGEISLKCMGDVGALVRAFERTHIDPDAWLVEDETEGWETKVTWKSFGASQVPVAQPRNLLTKSAV
ncbi:hypothetical protein JB92DRAFT_3194105 [Gautieria morchelliformis]|nr:hypothetical protein JB92DRAFT_3194105 [Gautieria morchelliformis]